MSTLHDSSEKSPLLNARRTFLASGLLAAPLLITGYPQVASAASKAEKRLFTSIQQHENDHVDFLVEALGDAARPKPTFKGLKQKKFKDFLLIAQALENTGVAAYLGAAPFIANPGFLAAAGSIMTIEARHAGALNCYQGDPVSVNNESFETAFTPEEVAAAAGGFVASLNDGPPLTYSSTPSEENDIDILNFALALEYLEAEFYNVNENFYS